ncbi:hypothetical protein GCM10023222_13860 [Saccharopolyspora cebuensis]
MPLVQLSADTVLNRADRASPDRTGGATWNGDADQGKAGAAEMTRQAASQAAAATAAARIG